MRFSPFALWPILFALAVPCGCVGKRAATTDSTDQPQSRPRALAADFDTLTGAAWSGTLSYKDYATGLKTTIRSSLRVIKTVSTPDATWEFCIGYADEPEAGSRQAVALLQNGTKINDELVMERTADADGSVRLVTERAGEDNNQPAILRYVYVISPNRCSIEKLVRPSGGAAFFQRNIYEWTR